MSNQKQITEILAKLETLQKLEGELVVEVSMLGSTISLGTHTLENDDDTLEEDILSQQEAILDEFMGYANLATATPGKKAH